MSVILRPLIKNSMQSYQTLATQMTHLGDFLGALRAPVRHVAPPPREEQMQYEELIDDKYDRETPSPRQVDPRPRVFKQASMVIVDRNWNADQVIRQVRQEV